MLDTDTKRRIDTARDILVGKVPDPKCQVEQITIALIYKFMDDMDAESEEFGGKRKFFAGEFARYGWAKLMRSGLGGHETLNLYAEAIAKMPENPGIPPLFRDIFKNAYLPYRDPETLKMFLKVIDEFNYDHSERLGDAFEYLLSVLGSQGDAEICGTSPELIRSFAQEVATTKPMSFISNTAAARTYLGEQHCQAFLTVGWMTGNVGMPGAMVGDTRHNRATFGGPSLVTAEALEFRRFPTRSLTSLASRVPIPSRPTGTAWCGTRCGMRW